jgi:hypothetical protein
MSYDAIARELKLSVAKVQEIEAEALTKCRVWCDKNDLSLADLLEADYDFQAEDLPGLRGSRGEAGLRQDGLDWPDAGADDGEVG